MGADKIVTRRVFAQALGLGSLLLALPAAAQPKSYDVQLADVPSEVLGVLESYVTILRSSKSLDECGQRFIAVAGGGLVGEDGKSLRATVQRFGLKKDFEAIKFYAEPTAITRVAKMPPMTSGFGASAIRGASFKIWIGKRSGAGGMPAPVQIMVPEGHKSITSPKVITIGSL